MLYMARKRPGAKYRGAIVFSNKEIPVKYRESVARQYQAQTGFIAGLENIKTTTTIEVETLYGLSVGDKFRLQSGVVLRVTNIIPVSSERKGMLCKDSTDGYLLYLE